MNEVQRMALEICQNRTDISEEKKERIRQLLESNILNSPSTSRADVSEEQPIVSVSLGNEKKTRTAHRFSRRRKIFGSDMCVNLGELKRENKWPSPKSVLSLATPEKTRDRPKVKRQLSNIVASKISEKYRNGHANMSDNEVEVQSKHTSNSSPRRNTIASEQDMKLNNNNLRLPTQGEAEIQHKNQNECSLRQVYRDLSLMRRTVSSCLTPEPNEQTTPHRSTPNITIDESANEGEDKGYNNPVLDGDKVKRKEGIRSPKKKTQFYLPNEQENNKNEVLVDLHTFPNKDIDIQNQETDVVNRELTISAIHVENKNLEQDTYDASQKDANKPMKDQTNNYYVSSGQTNQDSNIKQTDQPDETISSTDKESKNIKQKANSHKFQDEEEINSFGEAVSENDNMEGEQTNLGSEVRELEQSEQDNELIKDNEHHISNNPTSAHNSNNSLTLSSQSLSENDKDECNTQREITVCIHKQVSEEAEETGTIKDQHVLDNITFDSKVQVSTTDSTDFHEHSEKCVNGKTNNDQSATPLYDEDSEQTNTTESLANHRKFNLSDTTSNKEDEHSESQNDPVMSLGNGNRETMNDNGLIGLESYDTQNNDKADINLPTNSNRHRQMSQLYYDETVPKYNERNSDIIMILYSKRQEYDNIYDDSILTTKEDNIDETLEIPTPKNGVIKITKREDDEQKDTFKNGNDENQKELSKMQRQDSDNREINNNQKYVRDCNSHLILTTKLEDQKPSSQKTKKRNDTKIESHESNGTKKSKKIPNGFTNHGYSDRIMPISSKPELKARYPTSNEIRESKNRSSQSVPSLKLRKQNSHIQRHRNIKPNIPKTHILSRGKTQETFSSCRCHKHRQQNEKIDICAKDYLLTVSSYGQNNKSSSVRSSMGNKSKVTSYNNGRTVTDKLLTPKGKISEKNHKTNQKIDSYNSFNTCFKTLINDNTQGFGKNSVSSHVTKENDEILMPGYNRMNIGSKSGQTYTQEMTEMDGNVKNLTFADDQNETSNETNRKTDENGTDNGSEGSDPCVDDLDDDDVDLNDELNRIGQNTKRGKSAIKSANKSRTEFTLSSGFGSRTPYSEYDYTEKEIAVDVISNIIDDVIDSVWQANISRFKQHVYKTTDLSGEDTVGCIVLVDEEKQSDISFSCKVLNPSSFPATVNTYEILVGNITEVCLSGNSGVREGFIKIAVPFNKTNMRYFHEPVLRTFDMSSNCWISIDSFENIYFDENDSDLSVLETDFNGDTIFVVIARPTAENILFDNSLVDYDSRIDSDVTLSSPVGSRVRTDKVPIKATLLPISADTIVDTRDCAESDCQSLVGSSPIIIVEQSYKNPQPIFITVPCERPNVNAVKARMSSAPSQNNIITQSRLSKHAMHDFIETWSETESHLITIGGCDQMKCKLITFRDVTEDNKASFCIHEQKTTCFVMETKKEATRPNITKIAKNLLKVMKIQRVVISVLQNKDYIQDLTVTCDLKSKYTTRWRRRLEQEYDVNTKIASLKEGDIVSLNLRGNLTSIGKRFHIFRFHGSQSLRINWNLQVIDKYSQRSLDFYYGFVQLLNLKAASSIFEEVRTVDGHDWNIILEIPVRLPKHQIGSIPPPIKAKLQIIEEGPVTLNFLSSLAESLADQWMLVAASLQITHARLQSLRRQNRNNNKQLVQDLLYTWFKNMPHVKDKANMLVDVLKDCGKQELANTLKEQNDMYINEKYRIATEYGIVKILNTVIKSPTVVSKWQRLAAELGFLPDKIDDFQNSASSDQERCYNMLTFWSSISRRNWVHILAKSTRRIGCKYVADHLLSIVVKQKQLIKESR